MVTAVELARRLGVDPKRLRQWLRDEAAAGNPLVAYHAHNEPWVFPNAEAAELERQFLARSSPKSGFQPGPRPEMAANLQRARTWLVGQEIEFTAEGLRRAGFTGFVTLASLGGASIDYVPKKGGVYVVIHEGGEPSFLEANTGGRFKERDPTISIPELQAHWVAESAVVYVGKGDQLHRRVREFTRFGAGEPIGHWGGRLIWQLANSDQLRLAWLVTDGFDPRQVEKELLARFVEKYGRRPYANLTG